MAGCYHCYSNSQATGTDNMINNALLFNKEKQKAVADFGKETWYLTFMEEVSRVCSL